MFKSIGSRVDFPQMEEGILRFWKEKDVFHRSEEGKDKPLFMFFEGPPTANGSPGIHHVLARVFKDIICRYKTMKGYRPLRKGGWDTHGLPVELEIERELGLESKRDIEVYGIEKFNQRCRDSVFRYVKEWEALTERIGFWIDMEHPYVTLDRSYIETCWWIIKQVWDRGLIYRGMKGTPHCPRCVTSLSSHEVALGYRENTPDPSVYVKFPVSLQLDETSMPTYLLAWTTTPWTLPGNTALAVAPDADYSLIEIEGRKGPERLIMASALVERTIKEPYQVVETYKGSEIANAGLTYERLQEGVSPTVFLYDSVYAPKKFGVDIRRFTPEGTLEKADEFNTHIIPADFVSLEEGTGIVHIAPAFGDEDLTVGREHGLAFIQPVDLQGIVTGAYPFAGKFVKEADEDIMADLKERGLLYRRGVYHHTYPFCWRCDTPLLYYAKESWYIQTTAVKDQLISGNQEINWYPEYIKEGRFGEWLRNGVDWAISRERYWGTPMPIWQCQKCTAYHCIGTIAELKRLAVAEYKNRIDALDLHRPYVDEIFIQCLQCDGQMKRIPEVMDAWFDSGAMPFAQWNVTSMDQLEQLRTNGRFPADYICEAVDQTRGWFYSLLALSILITGEPSYKNVICLGLIQDEQGRKMSKTLGNVVDPWAVLNAQGADATRWYLFAATHPGDSRRFSEGLVNEVVRRFLLTLWNVYSFFITYANIDEYDPSQASQDQRPTSELDRWILSELSSLISQVDRYMDSYDPTSGGRRIQDFVDLLSNWYVRRSRRRFWKSESDQDKLSAYLTLYTCLVNLSRLLAPYTPFLAEEMYQNLVRSMDRDAPESVHLASFPIADDSLIDPQLMEATRLAMRISSLGRDARSRAGRKVRQPLQKILVKTRESSEGTLIEQMKEQILEELNVKGVEVLLPDDAFCRRASELSGDARAVRVDDYQVVSEGGYLVAVDIRVTPELAEEGLARELVHRIQNLRRAAGFEITDRILSFYEGPEQVHRVMTGFADYIRQETLSEELQERRPEEGTYVETHQVQGMEVVLGVKRIS